MSTTTILYTGKTHTTSGREGSSVSSDGALNVKLASPGSNRPGTNPEQLFAAGWSACFLSAIGIAASERKLRLAPMPPSTPKLTLRRAMKAICSGPGCT